MNQMHYNSFSCHFQCSLFLFISWHAASEGIGVIFMLTLVINSQNHTVLQFQYEYKPAVISHICRMYLHCSFPLSLTILMQVLWLHGEGMFMSLFNFLLCLDLYECNYTSGCSVHHVHNLLQLLVQITPKPWPWAPQRIR